MMRSAKPLALAILASATLAPQVQSAEYLYGFADFNVNYLDWSSSTERDSGGFKEDFYYLELEGGAGFDWGDIYGFFDLENAFEGNDQPSGNENGLIQGNSSFRIAAKFSVGYNIWNNWQGYFQNYYAMGNSFYDSTSVLGFRYKLFTESGFWITPFLGLNYTRTESWTGTNGGMLGWVFGYDFNAGSQKFSISNWHETEFGRNDRYGGSGGGGSTGHNGALAFWWHLPANFTVGLQYRYFYNKLGQADYGDAVIYTLKYNF
ncbi:outer membrane protein OmpK [Ferrimonas marina]|uniref:Nucleoside-specific channel-forming protein, Tsx n=1 Tax=Ferrimonas marina TaxID=299255 RepID=A0A1M5V9K7_9GAMM|nr:outer membrane protein OmpK [Ferrimonas marina]SHH71927.1 Nucleoside-specific channel-forming protein, Tsx [Ferrimonas marina]